MKRLFTILMMLMFIVGGQVFAQPTVTSVSPSRNATDISASSNIVITFSEDMDALGLIQPNAVTIVGSMGGKYSNVKSVSGFNDILTINPDSTFIPGEIITVFISAILNDANDGAIERFSYQFRVEANGTGVGFLNSSDKFTGSIGDNGANLTYLGDVDGDGDLDAAVITRTASDLKFYVMIKQNGSDSYSTPSLGSTIVDIADGTNPKDATFNDIDGDGDLDFIIFVNPGVNTLSYYTYLNNGSGSFSLSGGSFHSNLPTTDITGGVFSDTDRDGDNDLFILADNVYGLWRFANNGSGSFTEGTDVGQFASIAGRRAVSRDFNNDDYPDFAIIKEGDFSATATNDSLGILLSDGSGGYTAQTYNFFVAGQNNPAPRGMDAGDFDGDGYVDIAITTNDSLFIYGNDQDGTFTQRGYKISFMNAKLKVADMDNDGDLDIVALGNSTVIAYNDGSGNFNDSFFFSRGFSGLIADIGDADGDGDIDMVYSVNGTMTVLRNGTVTAPASNPSGIFETSNQGTSMSFSISGGTFNTKNLVLMKAGGAVDAVPVNNTAYTANSTFGSGSELGTGNFVVYDGTSSSFTVDGLDPNVTYHIQIFKFSAAGPNVDYNFTSPPTASGTTRLFPSDIVGDLSTSRLSTSMTLNWSGGGSSTGQNRIVLMKQGSAVDAVPVDSTVYTANAAFGSGTELGTGNYIVYDGSGSSVSLTGLTAETEYHFAIYEYDGSSGTQRYYKAESATISATTTPVPTIWSKSDSTLVFTKADNADWKLAANQDRITDNLWLTRQNNRGIFNYADETEYNSSFSPSGTKWALGATDTLENLTFDTWPDIHEGSPPDLVGEDMVLFIESDNLFIDINFSSWTESDAGGGFAYTRAKGPEPTGISQTFDDSAGFAVRFDGGNNLEEFLRLNTTNYSMGSSFSTEVWIKPDTTGIDQVFLALDRDEFNVGINASNQFYAYHSQTNAGSEEGGEEEFESNGIRLSPIIEMMASTDPVTITSTVTAAKDQWYHVAVTGESGGLLTLYVNGVMQDTVSVTDVSVDEDTWNLGSDDDRSKYFYGTADELRIWRSVRTPSQIRSFMHRPFSGIIGRIFAYWQFNEGTGTNSYDGISNLDAEFWDSEEAAWVTSDAPIGPGSVQEFSGFQNGIQAIGNASLNMSDGFDSPVDVQVTEVTGDPNQFPTGFSAGIGGKYFVINLFGTPGTFSADLTLTYGPGVVTAAQAANPSTLKLFKRGSNATGEWTEIGGATSANEGTGVVTWTGITAFSQFMSVFDEPTFGIGIDDNTDVIAYSDSNYTFDSDFFSWDSGYEDSAMVISAKSTPNGSLFLDTNDNNAYDPATDSLLTLGTSFVYTPSGSIPLRYSNSGTGLETIEVKLELGESADSVSLDFFAVEGSASIAGNNGEDGWYLLANPFSTTIGTLLSTIWTQGAINSDAPSADDTIYAFNQDSAAYYPVTTDLDTTTLNPGEGLLVYIYEDDDPTNGGIGGSWPKTLTNYGNPFGTDLSISVKNADEDGVAGTSGSEGFVLFGNPYGWDLSADSVIATLKRNDPIANSYVYRWNPTAKTYQILASGAIEAYESVFIRVLDSDTTFNLDFDYSDAFSNVQSKINTEEEPSETLVEFSLTHIESGRNSTSYVRIGEEGDKGIDTYDGYYLGTYSSTYANLYTQVYDQFLTINSLPSDLDEPVEYPIYMHSTLNGDFNLEWDASSIPDGWTIEIIDMDSDSLIDISIQNRYKIAVQEELNNQNRFKTLAAKSQAMDLPILTLRITPSITVNNEDDLGVPDKLELYQNYPNPFNPSTNIKFDLPQTSQVTIDIYNVLGQRVMTLVDGRMDAGYHNVVFNGRNLSSGVYFYRMTINGEQAFLKKMMLIK